MTNPRELIALMGLAPVEKRQLALDLAEQFMAQGRLCAILDAGQRLPITQDESPTPLQRQAPDETLSQALAHINAGLILWISSEGLSPDELLLNLDKIAYGPEAWSVRSIALIDTRTCDCFPQMREALEAMADITLMLPYTLKTVMEALT